MSGCHEKQQLRSNLLKRSAVVEDAASIVRKGIEDVAAS
jgi:hypothetical protein